MQFKTAGQSSWCLVVGNIEILVASNFVERDCESFEFWCWLMLVVDSFSIIVSCALARFGWVSAWASSTRCDLGNLFGDERRS